MKKKRSLLSRIFFQDSPEEEVAMPAYAPASGVATTLSRGDALQIDKAEITIIDHSGTAYNAGTDGGDMDKTELYVPDDQTEFLGPAETTDEPEETLAASESEETLPVPEAEPAPAPDTGLLCGKCGFANRESDKFCGGCGIPAAPPTPPAISGPMPFCDQCGTKNEKMENFCGSCGNKLTVS